MAEIGVYRICWGGPLDGRSVEFPPEMRYLPVSRAAGEARLGRHRHDWHGTLLGYYYAIGEGGARFIADSPAPVEQADGEDGN